MHRIGIHGVPRSGTTWLANIFNSNEYVAYRQQPMFSYKFKDYLNEFSSSTEIENFFNLILNSDDDYLNQKNEIECGKVPNFKKELEKTHLVYKEVRYHNILNTLLSKSNLNLILIIRNPLSVISSFYNAPSEFKPNWKLEEEWLNAPKKNDNKIENYFGYNKWKESAVLFHKLKDKFENRVTLLNYADLLKNTLSTVETLFNVHNIKITQQTTNFIKQSTTTEDSNAYSVFKTKTNDDDWKNHLTKSIIDHIEKDLCGTELEIYLKNSYV